MSTKPRIVFVRRIIHASRTVTQSTCPQCGAFVAASSEHSKLMIAESAHICASAAHHRSYLPIHNSGLKPEL